MPVLEANRGTREELEALQARRLSTLLDEILPINRFYIHKLAEAGLEPEDLASPTDLQRLPFTTKAELLADQGQHPPYGHIHTYPLHRYTRLHQTSGTSGRPLRWLDTPESWSWCLDCWQQIYETVGLRRDDRLLFAFSFGPFLGFWTAFLSGFILPVVHFKIFQLFILKKLQPHGFANQFILRMNKNKLSGSY